MHQKSVGTLRAVAGGSSSIPAIVALPTDEISYGFLQRRLIFAARAPQLWAVIHQIYPRNYGRQRAAQPFSG